MPDYAVTGKKGTGKSLYMVGVIRDALRAGRRVASNLDIHLDKLCPPTSRATYTRIPDRPTVEDFEALGKGQEGIEEDENGILVLDETSTFFNSRQFGDKSRQPMLDWLVHSRKYGWNVYYICQGLAQIDKQLRETQIEYHTVVKRTDKWPIPVITPMLSIVGLNVRFPKFHVGISKYGIERDALVVERKWYRGRELYPAYDTQQIFLDRDHPQACGIHSRLSSWHLRGRYLGWWKMNKHILVAGLLMGLALGFAGGGYTGYKWDRRDETAKAPEVEVDESVKVSGSFFDGLSTMVVLSDGRMVPTTAYKSEGLLDFYMVGGKWIKSQ